MFAANASAAPSRAESLSRFARFTSVLQSLRISVELAKLGLELRLVERNEDAAVGDDLLTLAAQHEAHEFFLARWQLLTRYTIEIKVCPVVHRIASIEESLCARLHERPIFRSGERQHLD